MASKGPIVALCCLLALLLSHGILAADDADETKTAEDNEYSDLDHDKRTE